MEIVIFPKAPMFSLFLFVSGSTLRNYYMLHITFYWFFWGKYVGALKLLELFKIILPSFAKRALKIALSFPVLKEIHNFYSAPTLTIKFLRIP